MSSAAIQEHGDDTHSGEPCDICGDVGYAEAIASCIKCRMAREHVYCMRVHRSEIPQDWVCETCLPIDIVSPKNGGKEDIRTMTMNSPDRVCSDVMHSVVPSPGGQACSKRKKPVDTGKVKFIPTEEAIKLTSGATKRVPPLQIKFCPKPGPPSSITFSQRAPVGSNTAILKSSTLRVKSNPGLGPSELVKPRRYCGARISSMMIQQAPQTLKFFKEKRPLMDELVCEKPPIDALIPAKEVEASHLKIERTTNKASRTPPPSRRSSPLVSSEKMAVVDSIEEHVSGKQPMDALMAVAECKKSDVEERDLLNFVPKLKLYRHNLPALHATWKGGFFDTATTPSKFYGGFRAQPPNTINCKAYKVSQKMPPVLQIKLLPRCELWEDLFQNYCPDLSDIALYFFPADNIDSSKQTIVSLFEMMEAQNLMMRSCVDGVELLIYTSKQLHVDSQNVIARLGVEYFLWGIFHCVKDHPILDKVDEELPPFVPPLECVKKDHQTLEKVDEELHPFIPPLECARGDHTSTYISEVVDMEIDMEGGKNMGRVDIVVSKDAYRMWHCTTQHLLSENNPEPQDASNRSCGIIDKIRSEFAMKLGYGDQIRRGIEVKAEGYIDEKPKRLEMENKRLKVTPFLNEGSSQSPTCSTNGVVPARVMDKYLRPFLMDVKPEIKKLEPDAVRFSHELGTVMPTDSSEPRRPKSPSTRDVCSVSQPSQHYLSKAVGPATYRLS